MVGKGEGKDSELAALRERVKELEAERESRLAPRRPPLSGRSRRIYAVWILLAIALIVAAWVALGSLRLSGPGNPLVTVLAWAGAFGAILLTGLLAARSPGGGAGAVIGVGIAALVGLVGAGIASAVQTSRTHCLIVCDADAAFLVGLLVSLVLAIVCSVVGAVAGSLEQDGDAPAATA